MYIAAKGPMREIGTAALGIRVARQSRRKKKTTRTTRITEITSEVSTSRSEARIAMLRSMAIARLAAGGREAWSCGRSARIRSRSEEHTSELQSLRHLVCRLLLEK